MRPTGEWLNQPGGLAERLTRLRKAAGLTGEQLAEQLGWPRSKVPKLENGRQMPTEADIAAWARATGQQDAAQELLALLAEAQTVHRQYRHQLRRGGHLASQRDLNELVRQARRVRNVETLVIPGLLQAPGYARCRLREAMRITGDQGDIEATVAERMRRQDVLYESSREFEFIIMEAAVRIRPCPDDVMLAQIDRLSIAAGLPSVTLAIIPMDAELAMLPLMGFLLADDVAYVETQTSEDFLHGEEAARYGNIADELLAEAVTGDETYDLLAAAAALVRNRDRRV